MGKMVKSITLTSYIENEYFNPDLCNVALRFLTPRTTAGMGHKPTTR